MSTPSTTPSILDRHFLDIRCGILDLAALLDRIERSPHADAQLSDPRMLLIRRGIEILQEAGTQRAEQVQMLFSDAYQEGWNRRPG